MSLEFPCQYNYGPGAGIIFFPYPNYIMFHNEFVHPILTRLGVVVERVPRSLRKLLKPSKCHEDNMKPLEHDWGSVFLLESATVIRVYGFPQPPHFFPRCVPERLGIFEFFWELTIMNKQYLGPDVKKGTFLCRSIQVGDFTIGKWAIEETNAFLREYRLPIAIARPFDPFGTITKALW